MSFLDAFAVVVLLVAVASGLAIFVILGIARVVWREGAGIPGRRPSRWQARLRLCSAQCFGPSLNSYIAAELRVSQMTELASKQAAPEFEVQQRQSEAERLRAQL